MQGETNFQELFNKTGEEHKQQKEQEKKQQEDNGKLNAAALVLLRFLNDGIPAINKLASPEDIRKATELHPAPDLEERLTAIFHGLSASMTLAFCDAVTAKIKELKEVCNQQRNLLQRISSGVHLSYSVALAVGSAMLLVLIFAVAVVCYNEYLLHDQQIARLYWFFGFCITVQNLILFFIAKRWRG